MATRDEILESIANMTVMEVADLIKAMEEKFGVTGWGSAVQIRSGASGGGKSRGNRKLQALAVSECRGFHSGRNDRRDADNPHQISYGRLHGRCLCLHLWSRGHVLLPVHPCISALPDSDKRAV